jgi:hypothetical protein
MKDTLLKAEQDHEKLLNELNALNLRVQMQDFQFQTEELEQQKDKDTQVEVDRVEHGGTQIEVVRMDVGNDKHQQTDLIDFVSN